MQDDAACEAAQRSRRALDSMREGLGLVEATMSERCAKGLQKVRYECLWAKRITLF